MKVIIAGTRTFSDYEKLKDHCDFLLSDQPEVEIVSGNAAGADKLGEQYAKEKGYKLTVFPADWNKYGKRAGYLRNKQMAEYADGLIAFWDGKSRGTEMMIKLAEKGGLTVDVRIFDQ